MEPASTIISLLGGDTAVAKIIGKHRTTVARWKLSREIGGLSGRIPQEYWDALIQAAEDRGIDGVTPDTLFRAPQTTEAA